jgi:hypothetical protein
MILAKASLNYNRIIIVVATVITIINYDHKTLIVQATGVGTIATSSQTVESLLLINILAHL